jgi:3',5'-cyclic AMP phosphodiesterase CpdA
MADRFRILQISDLHLTTSSNFIEGGRPYLHRFRPQDLVDRKWPPGCLTRLKAVARAAYQQHRLDAILITGDLAHRGDDASLSIAYNFVDSEPAVELVDTCSTKYFRATGRWDKASLLSL